MSRIQTRQSFIKKLLDAEVFEEQDKPALMNMKLDRLAMLVQNVWSPAARAAAKANRRPKSRYEGTLLAKKYPKSITRPG